MTLDPLLNSKNVAGISMGDKLMLRTRLSKLLGIEFPIFSAPMGPDLAGHPPLISLSFCAVAPKVQLAPSSILTLIKSTWRLFSMRVTLPPCW